MGGGGGGGGAYLPRPAQDLQDLIRSTKAQADQQEIEAEINNYLREVNSSFERDAEVVQVHLDAIRDVLADAGHMEKLLFGGSVAKRTYVEGLSDVDALVILGDSSLAERAPDEALEVFERLIRTRVASTSVQSVTTGAIAVTVRYKDGSEIQLLPAIQNADGTVSVPTARGARWRETDPKAFSSQLSEMNSRLGKALVPAIKLFKALNSKLPEAKQLRGYHMETLGLEAAASFQGTRIKDLLVHIVERSASRVLRPMPDVTGQSRAADAHLGREGSNERRIAADALGGMARELRAASTAAEWQRILES